MIKKFLPIIFIFLLWFIFSSQFFLQNKIPYPSDYQVNHFDLWTAYPKFWSAVKNPAMPDVTSQIMPWKKLTIESIKTGQVPLWNPYSFSGNPLLANYQSSVFSITNFFYFIFSFNTAWSLSVLIQPLLAGIFMFLFIRSLKLSQSASLISSVSFMFCGFITTWMSYTTLALAISFLPLALFSIEKFSNSKQMRFLFLLAISFPLSFLSGHFQTSLYFMLYVFSYILFKLFETKNKTNFVNFLSFSFLGILLSMPQILPSIELYLQAFRSSIFQKINPVPFGHLPTVIAPDFYGNPVTRNDFLSNYAEMNMFSGVIPFILAIFAIPVRSKKIVFFLFMSIISLALCIDTPSLNLFVDLKIPVLSTSSLSRVLVLFSFSIAVLSAFGFEQLVENLTNKKYKNITIFLIVILLIPIALWGITLGKLINPLFYSIALKNLILPTTIMFGVIFALIIAIANKRLIRVSVLILILLSSFDILRFAIKWQPFESKDLVFPTTPIISRLVSQNNIYRTYGPFGAEGSMYYKIPSAEGYDPLYINRYGQFLESLNDGKIKSSGRVGTTLPTHAKYLPKVIDLLGIRYVTVKTKDINKPWSFPIDKYPKNKFKLIYKEKGFLIYENKKVFPRAFLVENYSVINNNQKIIDKILNNNFNLRTNVVLEQSPKINQFDNLVGKAIITNYSPNKVEIQVSSNVDSILILTDNFYSGWKAKVNGKPTEILRADYTFRAVPVPKGESSVEFYYNPQSFRWGIILAALSIFGIGLILAGKWYTKRVWNHKQKTVKSAIKLSVKIAGGKQTRNKS